MIFKTEINFKKNYNTEEVKFPITNDEINFKFKQQNIKKVLMSEILFLSNDFVNRIIIKDFNEFNFTGIFEFGY